ncbi:GatB/YqeY domain-containing protein [Tuberibacillus sp. Marseille-P3662]|uniref:GatB/YqeY domain-containing protein n=1 Tax=Tuberibacillus sp. Marseille-P3662 TaxID=1965358 RepID=UPI000A1CA237|nr:GatB/YqeY domain-containing protein [Tuberibacillus sp. Marseille-P3662]
MSFNERLTQDMKTAMKSKDKTKLSVLRMLKASLQNDAIKLGKDVAAMTEDEVLTVLSRELKQRKDSLQEFENAARDDLVTETQKEIEIIDIYMPERLSEADLTAIIDEVINEVGATSPADMGKVMSAIMPKIKGQADGALVSQLVKDRLN